MSNVVVYVLLLDNLIGFDNAFNETISKNLPKMYSSFTPVLSKCNPVLSNKIVSVINRHLNAESMPEFKTNNNLSSIKQIFSKTSRETNDNSLIESNDEDDYFKKSRESIENNLNVYEKDFSVENNLINATHANKNITNKLENRIMAPFLVAIFETLSNVTAQTCAGTLIAPRWVLTAANCINILSNLYANDTNMSNYQSVYTIVTGANDPLSDGYVHNVTRVLQYQENSKNSSNNYTSELIGIGPHLAVLEIEPEFKGAGLQLIEQKVVKGDVTIYGWILVKDKYGVDTLKLMTISAVILSSAECQALYSYNTIDVICLFNSVLEKNITQLSSGGPVLMVQDEEIKMLGVIQTDEHVFIAYPLYSHYKWLNNILHNNNKD